MGKTVRIVLVTLAASAALAGCMAMGAQEKEGQLAAAGFVRQTADTPQKAAKLQSLPQNTMVFSQRKHGNVYIYADAAGCNCAFIGNDAAYQQYQQIRTANNIAQMQETTAMLNQEAAMDWGAYGGHTPQAGIDRRGSTTRLSRDFYRGLGAIGGVPIGRDGSVRRSCLMLLQRPGPTTGHGGCRSSF